MKDLQSEFFQELPFPSRGYETQASCFVILVNKVELILNTSSVQDLLQAVP
jgi:hypothetical protein